MNTRVNTLMEKELSRKEFLGMSGLAVASIFGFGTIVKLFTGKSLQGHSFLSEAGAGYGSSSYGGGKEHR